MNSKLKQFATHHWTASQQSLVLKDGPGTLHAVFVGIHPIAGEVRSGNAGLIYSLFDNSATAAGTLLMSQYANAKLNPVAPSTEFFALDVDFTQGLSLQLNAGSGTFGAVTVIFS